MIKFLLYLLFSFFERKKVQLPPPAETKPEVKPEVKPVEAPKKPKVVLPPPEDTKPTWVKNAEKLMGYHERKQTKILNDYFRKYSGWNFNVMYTPWCAAFINATLGEAGIKGTGSFMARSFLKFGDKVNVPKVGDIVVFKRGAPPSGHVAYFLGNYDKDHILVLGGNQSDEVCIKVYAKDGILGIRRV